MKQVKKSRLRTRKTFNIKTGKFTEYVPFRERINDIAINMMKDIKDIIDKGDIRNDNSNPYKMREEVKPPKKELKRKC